MWPQGWRERWLSELAQDWDLLIIGGGISGAGILREAAGTGLKVLLIEQNDFASGTSSKSSKLVHGGLRYLKTGQWRLTLESVRERERLLSESGGLVQLLDFVMPIYRRRKPGWWTMKLGLGLYDAMARKLRFRSLTPTQAQQAVPGLQASGLRGAFRYPDAQTDDARLTLRVIGEGLARGGRALNYLRAEDLLIEQGRVVGARVRDRETNAPHEIRARLVINVGGVWCDRLRTQVGGESRLRPLRGSHLTFDRTDIPISQAVGLFHPRDGRPVFLVPWEGTVLVGTTDLDHGADLDHEPCCTREEADYLLEALQDLMPARRLDHHHVISAWAGVRPVISSGEAVDPSKESREHALWEEKGLLTVTGGKLTTYRVTALQALAAARQQLPQLGLPGVLNPDAPILEPMNPRPDARLGHTQLARLYGRYGGDTDRLLAEATAADLQPIPETPYLWAELLWAARHEAVLHLQDLLLRRLRIGFLCREGGAAVLPQIRERLLTLPGWDAARWEVEQRDYLQTWQRHYCIAGSLPGSPVGASAP